MWLPEKSTDRPDPESRKSRSQGCVSGQRGAAHWYQTPLHFYLQTPIAQIHDYSMAQFEHWTKETFSANFRKMLTLEQYRDPKLAQLHHDYLAGGPLEYMAAIFRKLADSDETPCSWRWSFICEKNPEAFEKFEAAFPKKEKLKLLGQLF